MTIMSILQTGQIIGLLPLSSNYIKVTRLTQYSGFVGHLDTGLLDFALSGHRAVTALTFPFVAEERTVTSGDKIEDVGIETDVLDRPGDNLTHSSCSFFVPYHRVRIKLHYIYILT
jgi:hypothetical protein